MLYTQVINDLYIIINYKNDYLFFPLVDIIAYFSFLTNVCLLASPYYNKFYSKLS